MDLLEPIQRGERLGDSLQEPLADGNHVENVAVFGDRGSQGFTRTQRRRELIALEKPADAQDFRFDGGGNRRCGGGLHHLDKKGGL
jgi:hypothetical protein